MIQWLEPSIEHRISEVIEICEDENKELYDDFLKIHKKMLKHIPAAMVTEYFELDSLFVQKFSVIRTAYRMGLADGLNITSETKPKY